MTTKKISAKTLPAKTAPTQARLVFHRVHALLHTMRSIAQHEDELCTLLHAAESSKGLPTELSEEMHELLAKLPSQEYTDDLQALREALPALPAPRLRRSAVKKTKAAAKATTGRRR